jgi:hypothetical protein
MGCCSDAPDTSGINAAAAANADIAKEALAWYKQAYQEQAPMREEAQAISRQVAQAQLGQMAQQATIADDRWKYEKGTFRPLEQQMVADAQAFDTEGRATRDAGMAGAEVSQAMSGAARGQIRDLARSGIRLGADQRAGLGLQMAVQEAALKSNAMGTARRAAEQQGYARKMDAISIGRGLPGNQATNAQIATSAGNSAANTGNMANMIAQQGTNFAANGYQTAMQGNSSAGNLYGQQAQIQGQYGSDMAGFGQLAGLGLGAWRTSKMPGD